MDKETITNLTGQRIQRFRAAKRLTQEKLALMAGIKPAYLGQIERGLKCPTVNTLHKLSMALELPLPELLDFDSEFPIKENVTALERIRLSIRGLSETDADHVATIIAEIVDMKKGK